jgi:small subunit ribosomal protein S6
MREYELTVIYDLAVMEAGGAEASVQNLTTHVEARAGKVIKIDHWGRRRLAYPIGRAIDGDYIISRVEVDPASVNALEAAMGIDERILRHLIVRADELPVPPPPREPRRDPNAAAPVAEVVMAVEAPVAEVALAPAEETAQEPATEAPPAVDVQADAPVDDAPAADD